jgi:hypothetical protein
MSGNPYPSWLGTVPATALALPGNSVTVNGATNSTVMLAMTCPSLTISSITSWADANYVPFYRFGVSTGTYLCGATVTASANGNAWGILDSVDFRILDSNHDIINKTYTIYPSIDFRPYYLTNAPTSSGAVANNNMMGIFTATSNLFLTWEAAIINTAGYPATHKLAIEAPFFQRIDATQRSS